MLPTFDAVTEILKVTANEILKANQDESRAQGLTRAKSQKQVLHGQNFTLLTKVDGPSKRLPSFEPLDPLFRRGDRHWLATKSRNSNPV